MFVRFVGGEPQPVRPKPPDPMLKAKDTPEAGKIDSETSGAGGGGGGSLETIAEAEAEQAYRKAGTAHPGGRRKPAIEARQIMTSPVVTLHPDAPISEAWKLVRKHKFRHIPIVGKDGKIVGIISDRDLLKAGISDEDEKVRDVMSGNVLTAKPECNIREASRVMVEEKVSGLPIVDADHKVIGIITSTDVLKCVVNNAPLDLWI